jgi:hypothetical protein
MDGRICVNCSSIVDHKKTHFLTCIECYKKMFDEIFTILDVTQPYSIEKRNKKYNKILSKYGYYKKFKEPEILKYLTRLNTLYEMMTTIVDTFLTGEIIKHNCRNYSYRFEYSLYNMDKHRSSKCELCFFVSEKFLCISFDQLLMKIVKREDIILRNNGEYSSHLIDFIKLIDYDSILHLAYMLSHILYCSVSGFVEHTLVEHAIEKNVLIEYIRTKYIDTVKKMQLKYINTKIPVELYEEERQELTEKDINDNDFFLL